MKAANTTSARAAKFRLTNELATTEHYTLTQAWAATFHRSGFGGAFYLLRFSPGGARGLALFGPAGAPAPPWPGDANPAPVREVVESYGIEVVEPPAYGEVTLVTP